MSDDEFYAGVVAGMLVAFASALFTIAIGAGMIAFSIGLAATTAIALCFAIGVVSR